MCRREGIKLYLKGERCFSPKCPVSKEDSSSNPPGMHGARKSKTSEYGIRLREKQKLKRFYGILENQFRRYYQLATRSPMNTGEQLLSILERRLDNIVHRLGLANCRTTARQMVAHGHIQVNGIKCRVPSMLLKPGDVVKVKTRERSLKLSRDLLTRFPPRVPDFLALDNAQEEPSGRVIRMPNRQDVDERIGEIREQLIIEIAAR